MKLDELEKMAKQTAAFGVHPSGEYIYSFYTEQLQAFAKLVADKVYADYLEAPEPRQSGKLSITFETSPDLELIYQANSADIEALEDARFTLSAIQKTDSAHDEMINESIRLIDKALNINFIPVVERLFNITKPQ
jgi:hypothetical protein